MNDNGNLKTESAHDRIGQEWVSLISETSPDIRHTICTILFEHEDDLKENYLRYLEEEPDICAVISTEIKRLEFAELFLSWIKEVVSIKYASSQEFIEKQEQIGELMARINYPPYAISRGIRNLILWFIKYLSRLHLPTVQFIEAIHYVVCLMNLSLELREIAYQRGITNYSRIDEAYRLYSLGQNLGMEKERQRALLMEWGHRMLTSFHQGTTPCTLPRIWRSEFGHWLNHKARILFERSPEMQVIIQSVDKVDQELVPMLEQADYSDRPLISDLIRRIEAELSAIKFGLNNIFEIYLESENGRDPLTQLLNRRFMAPVLMREISLQKNAVDHGFCTLLLDIDHFKKINDNYGHSSGDVALQNVASIITRCIRPSDFVFRYGGEEIVIVLVDCDRDMGKQIAEKIRHQIASTAITLPDRQSIRLTVSIGVAPFIGELDYESIIARADKAMYSAKVAGRNRVGIAG